MRHLTPRFLLLWLFSSLYNGVKPERHGSGDIVESQITFTCKFRDRHCNGLSKTKRAGTKETIRLPLLYPSYNNTCTLEEPQATQHLGRTADVYKSACKYACLPLQSVFTHVAGSYANLWQQKKVWISLGYWETAQPPHPQSPSQPFFGCQATLPRFLLGERCVTSKNRLRGRLPHP